MTRPFNISPDLHEHSWASEAEPVSLCQGRPRGGLAAAATSGWFRIVPFLSVTALGPGRWEGVLVDRDGRGLGREGW